MKDSKTQTKRCSIMFSYRQRGRWGNWIYLFSHEKRGFGKGRWNGVGSKVDVEHGERIENALVRKTQEEISVSIINFNKVAELSFYWPDKLSTDMNVLRFSVKAGKVILSKVKRWIHFDTVSIIFHILICGQTMNTGFQ